VTSFEYQLHEVWPTVLSGLVFYPAEEAEHVLRGYRAACAAAPDELTTLVDMTTAPPLPFLPESVHGKPIIGVGGCWSGDLDAGEAATAPFRSLGTVIADVFAANPYTGWQQALDPLYPRRVHNYFRSAFLRTADDASLHVLMDSLATLPNALTEIPLQHLGTLAVRWAGSRPTQRPSRSAIRNSSSILLPERRRRRASRVPLNGREAWRPLSVQPPT